MKIIDIQRFINNVKMIFESTPLTHIRKSIMGKGNPIKIDDEDYDWYSNNKNELLKVLNMIVGPDASNDLKVLSNFNTTKYFTEGKPQKLKPKELKNALMNQIHAINARKVYSGNKLGTAFSNQYEKMEMENGVEVYKFDASDFITSGMHQSVTLEDLPVGGGVYHKFLVMTFLTAGGGTETVRVDLEDLIDAYSAASGGGLTLNTATNEFSITNTVTPNTAGVNAGQTITFGSDVTLNTITYDAHGSITGTKAITFNIPALAGGSVGTSGSVSRVVTYATIDANGTFTGEYANVVNSTAGIDNNSTDAQIPTAKAVYGLVDSSITKWNRF